MQFRKYFKSTVCQDVSSYNSMDDFSFFLAFVLCGNYLTFYKGLFGGGSILCKASSLSNFHHWVLHEFCIVDFSSFLAALRSSFSSILTFDWARSASSLVIRSRITAFSSSVKLHSLATSWKGNHVCSKTNPRFLN